MAALRGGIDLGGTKIEAIVVDAEHQVLANVRRPTPTQGGPKGVARAMADALGAAARDAGVGPSELVGVGVGSPGSVDSASGVVSSARNLPGWEGSFPLGPALTRALGTPTVITNDVSAGTQAEFNLGPAREFSSGIGVFWGTGIGGGIILNREMWHGRGGAGEIGHIVYKPGGRRCGCGHDGCVEAYAGRASMEAKARREMAAGEKSELVAIMERKGRERFTSSVWAEAHSRGDKLAERLLDQAVEALGVGIASMLNVLDVGVVVIGGGLGLRFGRPFLERIVAAMEPHLFPGHELPTVELAGLGDLGGAIGAAMQVDPARATGVA